jgi:hypothetical protein
VLKDQLQVNDDTAAAFYDSTHNSMKNYRFITLDNVYVGLVEGDPAVGDEAYVLFSSPVP